MPLKVEHDGSGADDVAEHCCMCRAKTRYWYKEPNVALCQKCAKTTKKSELPTKDEWCRKERELYKLKRNYA